MAIKQSKPRCVKFADDVHERLRKLALSHIDIEPQTQGSLQFKLKWEILRDTCLSTAEALLGSFSVGIGASAHLELDCFIFWTRVSGYATRSLSKSRAPLVYVVPN